MKEKTIICERCGAITQSLYASGCNDCGEERIAAASRLGRQAYTLVDGVDFIPNHRCRRCCPTRHGTRSEA